MWKTVERQWFWWAHPLGDQEVETAFGTHKPSPPGAGGSFQGMPGSAPSLDSLINQVKADKRELRFDAATPATERIVITSQMPGAVSLSVEPPQLAGLEFKFDRANLNRGESATLSVAYQPSPDAPQRPSTKIRVVILPMDQEIPITLVFRQPPPANRSN
jgi:hypothetical protein